MNKKRLFTAALLLVFALAHSTAEATVLRVAIVKTDDIPAYVDEIGIARGLYEDLGLTAEVRVWRARFAGPDTGSVVVSVEWADMATFAAEDAILAKSDEWHAWLKKMASRREIISDSLYDLLSE
jgi:hypothetical protein